MGRSGGGGFSGGGFGGGFSGGGGIGGGFSGGSGGRSNSPSFGGGFSGGGGYSSGGGGGFFTGMLLGSLMSSKGGGGGGSYQPSGGDPRYDNGGGSNKGGCSGCLKVLIVFFIAMVFCGMLVTCMNGGVPIGSTTTSTESTVEREALPLGTVEETGYFVDSSQDWIDDPKKLDNAMRQFCIETGVVPFLDILPNGSFNSRGELTQLAQSYYESNFEDGNHFVLVFCDDDRGHYNAGYYVGAQAKSVMDSEALSIFGEYLSINYDNMNLDETEIFADTYTQTADRIMTTDADRNRPVAITSAVVVGIIIVAVIIALILRGRRAAREREQKRQQEILNTPLERFGEDSVEALAKEYEASKTEVPQNAGVAMPDSYSKFGDDSLRDLENKYNGDKS